jgi:hypothetical protein
MSGMGGMDEASKVDVDEVQAEMPAEMEAEYDFASDERLAEMKEKLKELDNYKEDIHWEDRFYQIMKDFIDG